MDAGTLRIILIVFGVLLLGALYLWEKRRIETEAEPEERAPDDEPEPELQPAMRSWRREPSFGRHFGAAAAPAEAELNADRGSRTRTPAKVARAQDDIDADAADPARSVASHEATPSNEAALDPAEVRASSAQGPRSASAAVASEGQLLVQLFVVTRGQPFNGAAVRAAAERQYLVPGEMDIYHRHNLESGSQRALFSMANLVNPGTFPFQAMDSFTTPGVALFTQLDGMPSDLMVYDELVQTARTMADELGADLLLPDRRAFDDDAWEELRIELLSLINDRADALTRPYQSAQGADSIEADDDADLPPSRR
ncbi:MAG: cell division protein ZipA [Halochromatium sp.]|nr:cell division protein ZipA [Halochromatium sp.]